MALVDAHRARDGLELERGQEAAPSFTRTARDAGHDEPEPASKVAEVSGERAARERARRAQELVNRRVDARALLEVRDLAASLGEVTRGRLNTAYRRLHPVLHGAERRRRALVLTPRGHMVDATVRGPHGAEFRISRRAGTDERALIAILMRRIEAVVGGSAGPPTVRNVDPNPMDTRGAHEPNVDMDALAEEPGDYVTTATGFIEPETTVDVMRAIEELTGRILGERKREVTAAAPGTEGQEDVDTNDEGRLAGEAADPEEHTIEDGFAGPRPRGEAADQEGGALVADPGVGADVHAPTEHVPPLPKVVELHPALLELAERGSRRRSPDMSAPLLTQSSSEASPSPVEDEAPPTAGDQAPPRGTNPRRPPPTRRAAIVRRAGQWRDRRVCQRDLWGVHRAQAPPPTRQPGGGQAQRGRSPPTSRGYARTGPRNRGPPPQPRQ